jgi:putative FmdB family regulatory protein
VASPITYHASQFDLRPSTFDLKMPLYEYLCQSCGKKFTVLVGVTAEKDDESCSHCGSKKAKRLVSRFRRGRSEDERVDELADKLEVMGEPESPSEMRGMVKEMGKALDEDVSEEMDELFEADMEGKGEEEE